MEMKYSKEKLVKEKKENRKAKVLSKKQKKVILTQQARSLCQITTKERNATGFLCNIPTPVLITSNYVLDESQIEPGKEIDIYFKDEDENKSYKKIIIDETRTTYTVGKIDGEEINTTIIELKPDKDNLVGQEFMEIDTNLMNEKSENLYEAKDIYQIYYDKGQESAVSTGIINEMKKKNKSCTLFYTCNKDGVSSGSPIVLYTHKVIGVNIERLPDRKLYRGTLLQFPIKEYIKKLEKNKLFAGKKNSDIEDIKNENCNNKNKNDEEKKLENNIIKMVYKINNEEKQIKVLNSIFVNNNKKKFKLIINNKECNLCQYIECNQNDSLLTISIKETKKATNMNSMFDGCESLISLDFQSFKTDRITCMCSMFAGCKSLNSINFGEFKTDRVTNMSCMFYGCESLTSLDLRSFNTQNVTHMNHMFCFCSSLTSLNLSSFKTENVINMSGMFYGCESLTSLDLQSFNTENVNDIKYMFKGCSSLEALDMSSFNTQNVIYMKSMFEGCSSLISVNLSSFNATNAETCDMFDYCRNLLSYDSSDQKIIKAYNNKK